MGAQEVQDRSKSGKDKKATEEVEKEKAPPKKRTEREPKAMNREKQLQAAMKLFIKEQGGSVEGPRIATEIAPRYNQWVRSNSGRNDGSFRKWVDSTPGLHVDHCGQNK